MTFPRSPNLAAALVSERTHFRIPSRLEWIDVTVEYLHTKAIRAGLCSRGKDSPVALALREALLNAVLRGNLEIPLNHKERGDKAFAAALAQRAADPTYANRTVELHIDLNATRCQWSFTDQGAGFDVNAVLRSYDAPGSLFAGRGLLIMRAVMNEVRYEDGGRRLLLTLRRAGADQARKSVRFQFENPIEVFPIRADDTVDYEHTFDSICLDLTQTALTFLHSETPAAGRVMIGVVCDGAHQFMPATVHRTKQLSDDLFETVCRFDSEMEVALRSRLARLGLPAGVVDVTALRNGSGPHPRNADRRVHSRVAYTERVSIKVDDNAEPVEAFARDLSKGGISLLTTFPLPVGESRTVRIPLPQGSELRLSTRIIRCTEIMKGCYDVAGQFQAVAAS